jgi:NAD dependent epimerase/dehydratase family enzyme
LGGSFGSGKQRMSWIAIQDLVSIYERALEDSTFSGPVNAVAPKAAAVAEFAQTLGSVLKRPAFLPAPAFALKIAFGEMATETILSDLNILPQRLQNANFKWNYPDIQSALAANI